jgi:predicted solute-binding protein
MLTLALSLEQFNGSVLDAVREGAGDLLAVRLHERPADAERLLREGECDLALVSPLTYAAQEADFSVIPNAAVSAVSATGDLLLVFKPGLHHVETVGVRASDSIDAILAQIILREKYDMRPRAIPYKGAAEQALHDFDAMVIRRHDDDGFLERHGETIDLIDEWFDMTQLPFVRLIFAGWTHRITEEVCTRLAEVCARVDAGALDTLRGMMEAGNGSDALHTVPGHYRYMLDEEAMDGLNRFSQLAFFHGLHRDIPTYTTWTPPGND